MSKILYLIASHTKPDQVMRLVKTIRSHSPDSYILIHHDYSSSILDRSAFEQLSNVQVMEDFIPGIWGEFSLVAMELHCIDWLLTHSIHFDWLIFLSGQDYPIQPFSEIEQFLQTTEYDGFMEYFLATDPPLESVESGLRWQANTGFKRFFYHHYKLPNSTILNSLCFKLGRLINNRQSLFTVSADRNGSKLGIRCSATPFNSTFQCYAGSQWHTLSRRCIQYIYDFVQRNPSFVKHYQKTVIPDESFFQTILVNNPQLKICNDNKRYIPWFNSQPVVFGMQDFDRLVASNQQFARKFDLDRDARIFDRLDQHIQAKNTQTKRFISA